MNFGFAGVRKTQTKPRRVRFLLSAVDCAHDAISSSIAGSGADSPTRKTMRSHGVSHVTQRDYFFAGNCPTRYGAQQ
jgi:hypothetical protein